MPSRHAALPGDDAHDLLTSSVRSLSRNTPLSTSDVAGGANGVDAVRPPGFRWKSRVLLPAALLVGFASALAYTARDALMPPRSVKVVPVVLAPGGGGAGVISSVGGA